MSLGGTGPIFSQGAAVAMGLMPRAAMAALPVTEGYAPVPGGRIWWMKVGVGDKTPLLTLHGGPGAGRELQFWVFGTRQRKQRGCALANSQCP